MSEITCVAKKQRECCHKEYGEDLHRFHVTNQGDVGVAAQPPIQRRPAHVVGIHGAPFFVEQVVHTEDVVQVCKVQRRR